MGNVISVLAAFIAIVVVFSLAASALASRRELAVLGNAGFIVPSQTLLVLVLPVLSIFWCGFYERPQMPWFDMLGIALANAGYAAIFILLIVRAPFTLLGLFHRSHKWITAVAFIVGGAVLQNRNALLALSGP